MLPDSSRHDLPLPPDALGLTPLADNGEQASSNLRKWAVQLEGIAARLGTPAERPGDLDASVTIAHWIKNQMQVLLLTRGLDELTSGES